MMFPPHNIEHCAYMIGALEEQILALTLTPFKRLGAALLVTAEIRKYDLLEHVLDKMIRYG